MPAFGDNALLDIATRLQKLGAGTLGATGLPSSK